MKKWICCSFGIAFLCNSAVGQPSQALGAGSLLRGTNFSRNAAGNWVGTASFNGPRIAPLTIVGAPFSAEEHYQNVKTLTNGAHITDSTAGPKIYRDSQGRTRTEVPAVPVRNDDASNAPAPPRIIEINDSVAGLVYVLDPVNKVVHRLQTPARPRAGGGSAAIVGGVGGIAVTSSSGVTSVPTQVIPAGVNFHRPPQSRKELMGSKDIQGILADGEREILTYETGSQGNDAPFDVVTETWTSPQLKLQILTKTMDPRSGDHIFELKNLSAAEPDPSLFVPPADYQMVDETGQFTITFK